MVRFSISKASLRTPTRARRKELARLLAIGASLCFVAFALKTVGSEPQEIKPQKTILTKIDYQIYALQQLRDLKEWKCLLTLYSKESAWDITAVNGSHYNIPQGNSKWLKNASGYAAIDWGIRYNHHRYKTMCNALHHWSRYGWH